MPGETSRLLFTEHRHERARALSFSYWRSERIFESNEIKCLFHLSDSSKALLLNRTRKKNKKGNDEEEKNNRKQKTSRVSIFFFTLPFFFFDFVRFPTVLFPICEVAASAAAAATTTTATAALAAVGLFLAHSFSQLMPSPARPATRASPFDFVWLRRRRPWSFRAATGPQATTKRRPQNFFFLFVFLVLLRPTAFILFIVFLLFRFILVWLLDIQSNESW